MERREYWHAAMRAVPMLRYPRAVIGNNNRIQRGGHVWFQRHTSPKKGSRDGGLPSGLEVLWVEGEARQRAGGADRVAAQPLPQFDPANPESDRLYGYDLFKGEGSEWSELGPNRQTYHRKLEPFDPSRHVTGNERSGGFQGQNRESRQSGRRDTRGGY